MVCDFQAIYRLHIDPDAGDLAGLTGPQFLRLASRLPAFDGAVRVRIRVLSEERSTPEPTGPAPAAQMLDATPLMLTTHPLLAQFIEYSTAPPAE